MDKSILITELYKIGAIQFGEFTLKSGQKSNIYINLRKIISYPGLLQTIAEAMWQATQTIQYDLVCGVPYTALPIATCLSIKHYIPMLMRRKEKKDYGTKQLIEGVFTKGQSCLILEDVITTGGSIIETANELKLIGVNVNDVIVLIDREQGGRENLAQYFHVHCLLTLSEILSFLSKSDLLNTSERHFFEQLLQSRKNS